MKCPCYNDFCHNQQIVTDTRDETVNYTLRIGYDALGTPLTVNFNGTTYFYAVNLQGDVIAILDADGNAVVTYSYDAWGNPTGGTRSSTDPNANALYQYNPLRYRGYVYDFETGLYYLQSRYYNPANGRFINADGLVATGQGILGNNMYTYCGNNPVINYDPTGHCFHHWNFWHDCEKCGGKTIHEKLENTKFVVSSGYFASVNVGAFNITGTIECAFDLKGNIQLFSTFSFDVTTTGGFSATGGSTDTMLFAPDTSYLKGDSNYLGGGVSCPIPNTPIAGTSTDNILLTSDGYWGTNSTTGISYPSSKKIGGEVHGGYSYTKPWTKRLNIFDGLDIIVDWCTSG